MNKRIPILHNPTYSEILIKIHDREVYATSLAKEINKNQPTVLKQLNILKKEEFVDSKPDPTGIKNKKLFYIRWEKIIKEYVSYLMERKKEIDGQKKVLAEIAHYKKLQKPKYENYFKDKELQKSFQKNKYVIHWFQALFKSVGISEKKYTIIRLFDIVTRAQPKQIFDLFFKDRSIEHLKGVSIYIKLLDMIDYCSLDPNVYTGLNHANYRVAEESKDE